MNALFTELKKLPMWMLFIALVVIASLVAPNESNAAVWPDIELSWKEPTTRADGKPLPRNELSEYRIYLKAPGAAAFTQLTSVKAEDKADYKYLFKQAAPKAGEHCFHLTAVDTKNLESVPSTNFCIPYQQFHAPSPPTNIRVVLTVEVGSDQ